MRKIFRWVLIFGGVVLFLLLMLFFAGERVATRIWGEAAESRVRLDPGNIQVPHERTIVWNAHSSAADSLYRVWAGRPLNQRALSGRGSAPRVLQASLLAGVNIPLVNATLMKMTVWGISGSTWALNKHGDYDFTITVLTSILWMYGEKPELVYPATRDYLLGTLLSEDGNKFRYTAPRSLGLVRETENHVLMTEGSRYLKNRWMMLHGNKDPYYDNKGNGMEKKLLAFMEDMRTASLYEFNSLPYAGYTIAALLNLEAFASDTVRKEARDVLDYMNWCYALGSYRLKHYPPMRRRYEKEGIQALTNDYQSVYMKAWLSYSSMNDYDKDIHDGEVHFITGASMPYRPPDAVISMLFDKGSGYFVKLGHGPGACPEIYSAGRHFLLSAGGVNRGKRSLIVARPITLFLDDSAASLRDVIHLAGPGKDFMGWNNTGVCRNFACAAGPVYVPAAFVPAATSGNWRVYSIRDSLCAAVYSTDTLGLVVMFEGRRQEGLMEELLRVNPDANGLRDHFQFPGGEKVFYDVHAPADRWVIVSDGGKEVDREFDKWALIEGL